MRPFLHVISGGGLLAATLGPAQGGELMGGYVYVIGESRAQIPAETMQDWGRALFSDTRAAVADKWSRDCGVQVQVEHTSLMNNETDPWAAGYWVAYLAFEPTIKATLAALPATDCATGGYIKATTILSPSIILFCATEAPSSDLYISACL